MNDDLGIAVGLENRTLPFEAAANLLRVHQISVVRQRHDAFVGLHHDGLGIEQRRISGGGITRMADGEGAMQLVELFLLENVGHQSHGPVGVQRQAVRGDDAGRFLAAMLQRVQTQVSELLGLGMGMNRDHPAFLPELVGLWHFAPRSLGNRQSVSLPLPVPPAAPSRARSRKLRAARPRSPTPRLDHPILFLLVPEPSLRSFLG